MKDRDAIEVPEPMEKTLLETKCPDCSGPLWEERQGRILEYRCRVGHAYSPLALEEEQQNVVEKALWTSVITLENAASMAARLQPELSSASVKDGREKREHAVAIKRMLGRQDQ